MLDTLVVRAKGFIMDPVGTYKAMRDEPVESVAPYFAVLLVIHAILNALLSLVMVSAVNTFGLYQGMMPGYGMGMTFMMPVFVFAATLVAGVIVALLFGAWLHLWVYIVGGRNGIGQTIKAFVYGMTPYLAFGWIPLLGVIFALWSFILDILGLRELAGLSTEKAVLALIIAILIPFILVIILIVAFIMPFAVSLVHMSPETMY